MTASAQPSTPPPAFELKAAGFTLPVIRLLGVDMDAVAEQVGAKVEQAPDFFRNTPVVIDLRTGDNPFKGRRNTLTPRQQRKRKRLLRRVKKS